MILNKRDLLVFQRSDSNTDLQELLAAYQWRVHRATELQQVIDLQEKLCFQVGLCLVDKCEDRVYLETLQKLFSLTTSVHWIMGLPKQCKPYKNDASPESRLIAEHCHDYLIFPASLERLLFALGHAYGMSELLATPHNQSGDNYNDYGIIGKSPAMITLFKLLDKISKEECSVLIEGETGTGKEMAANAIHKHSHRAKQPLVALNCGAFPKDLIQTELFGYEKGAFTGAAHRKIGRIESAQGGTLFLDEIGDLPMEQQVNLLRFLEERTINRVGGREKIPIDVRVIAATHVDLIEAIHEGRFREDLYYRLRVLHIKMPPLRNRDHDIELLAQHFFNTFNSAQRYKPKGISPDALFMMRHYDWPGNVRELMNCIRHAVVMSDNRLLTPTDLSLDRRIKERTKSLEEARAYAERESIINSLHDCNFNMSRTAKLLCISRVSLYRLINKYKLNIQAHNYQDIK